MCVILQARTLLVRFSKYVIYFHGLSVFCVDLKRPCPIFQFSLFFLSLKFVGGKSSLSKILIHFLWDTRKAVTNCTPFRDFHFPSTIFSRFLLLLFSFSHPFANFRLIPAFAIGSNICEIFRGPSRERFCTSLRTLCN